MREADSEGTLGKFANKAITLISIFLLTVQVSGQVRIPPPPQRPIEVNSTSQGLSFGAFYHGASGGTITVAPTGARTSTGSVVALSTGTFTPAMFEIKGTPGTIVTILNGSDVFLTGSNGGTIRLTIGESSPSSPFLLSLPFPQKMQLFVGGTLTIGNSSANPPGSYSGSFVVIFNQQ